MLGPLALCVPAQQPRTEKKTYFPKARFAERFSMNSRRSGFFYVGQVLGKVRRGWLWPPGTIKTSLRNASTACQNPTSTMFSARLACFGASLSVQRVSARWVFGANLAPTWPPEPSQNRPKLVPKCIKKSIKILTEIFFHFYKNWKRFFDNFGSKLEGRGPQNH